MLSIKIKKKTEKMKNKIETRNGLLAQELQYWSIAASEKSVP
jgi:hypothetical protein